jgi:hypothetical protein
LSRLLEGVREQQVALVRKVEVLQKRVGLLRDRGELDEAIQLLQEHLASSPGNPSLQDLVTALLTEREQKQATRKAVAAAREAAQRRDFSAGLASLEAVQRAYGESTELSRALQEVRNERFNYAQEIVGKSIELARAALLANDPQGALEALKAATQAMEFADPKKQADWQRIASSVKKVLQQSGAAASGPGFDKQLAEIAKAKPRKKIPMWAIASAGAVLVSVGIIAVWKLQPAPPPSVAHIKIAKAPPGASISIDNGPPSLTNPSGEATIQVSPGSHQLQVSQEGFAPFIDKLEVNAGETVQDDVSLAKLLPAGTSGTLSPQGNVAEFKLSVDGKNMGLHRVGESIPLEMGTHKVKYSAQDDSDSQEHTIQISVNKNSQDTFFLKPPPAKPQPGPEQTTVGKLVIQTNPGAQVTIDGQYKGSADSGGNYSVQGLNGGQHAVGVSLDKFQSVNREVSIAAGQTQTLVAQLQAVTVVTPVVAQPSGSLSASSNSIERGKSVQLSWQVSNASSISISGIGPVAPQGSTTVYPGSTTKYQLIANGSTPLGEQTVDVYERAQPAPTPADVPSPAKPTGPDRAALEPALNAYKSLFAGAAAKGSKGCKASLNGAFSGGLRGWAQWCDDAKSFAAKEVCSQPVGGTPEAPTLTCAETITINLKEGVPSVNAATKTFHFRNSNGNWQISGW